MNKVIMKPCPFGGGGDQNTLSDKRTAQKAEHQVFTSVSRTREVEGGAEREQGGEREAG